MRVTWLAEDSTESNSCYTSIYQEARMNPVKTTLYIYTSGYLVPHITFDIQENRNIGQFETICWMEGLKSCKENTKKYYNLSGTKFTNFQYYTCVTLQNTQVTKKPCKGSWFVLIPHQLTVFMLPTQLLPIGLTKKSFQFPNLGYSCLI